MPTSSESFVNALSGALQKAGDIQSGSGWELHPITSGRATGQRPGADAGLVNVIRLQGALRGILYICPDEAASHAAFVAAGSSMPEDLPSAWSSLLQNLSGEISHFLTGQFGDVKVSACSVEQLPNDPSCVGALQFGAHQAASGTISLFCDATLLSSIEGAGNTLPVAEALSLRDKGANAGGSFERVIDVPLAVTIRFGKRQLTVRELLELNMGSLVELDRQVEEPVDLMLGERLIARGEVVIVDGNYGMRVTEVVEQPSRRSMGIH